MNTWLRFCLVTGVALFAGAAHARAWTLQVPAGADAFVLPNDQVLCGPVPEGFSLLDAARRHLRPRADAKPGTSGEAHVAATLADCGNGKANNSRFVVTGPLPSFDPGSVTLAVDAARLELRGKGLEGVRVTWTADGNSASDVCSDVVTDKDTGRDTCTLRVDDDLPADPRRVVLHWVGAGGVSAPDTIVLDADGHVVGEDRTRLPIARVIVHRMFPPSHALNVASGEAHIELEHPEAVSSVECGAARCEVRDDGPVVGAIPAAMSTLQVRVRLLPHVFFARGDAFDSTVSEALSVLRCPLAIVSGEPLRNVDDLQILVKLDASCGAKAGGLRWTVNGDTADVTRTESLSGGVYVLLWVGRITGNRVNVVASAADASVVAVTSENTVDPPTVATSLSLPGFGEIDFIPKNRDALLSISHAAGSERLVPISVPGAYEVTTAPDGFHIRGVYASGGYTALRFAYRIESVPPVFANEDFARLVDPVQRPIKEANVPAPIGASSVTDKAVVELWCAGRDGKLRLIVPGSEEHIAFSKRDSCRLVVHRERIPEDSGQQRINLEVSVTGVGGEDRGEAKLSQTLTLRHGTDQDVIWVRGAKQQFDHITIRMTHVVEDVTVAHENLALPSAQWTLIAEDASFKFYVTAAIPASLYRFSSDPGDLGTGPLSLNFGVLSRLTWLDSDGHEGIFGLEAGVMGMGLAIDRERQLALVTGIGLTIPIGNLNQASQASINIHAWASYSVGDRHAPLLDEMGQFKRDVKLNPWAFVFGPSITIGSFGVFL